MYSSSQSKYESIGLETNPFPFSPTPSRPWLIAGKSRVEAYELIKKEIELSKEFNQPKVNVIEGDYGSGKTHLALYLVNYGLENLKYKIYLATVQDALRKPTLALISIKLVNSLGGEEFLRAFALNFLSKIILENKEKLEDERVMNFGFKEKVASLFESRYKEQKIRAVVEEVEEEPEKIVEFINEGNLNDEALLNLAIKEVKEKFETNKRSLILRNFVDVDILREILLLPFSEHWKYYSKRRYESMIKFIEGSEDNALLFLATLVNLMKYVGKSPVVLVIDEVDAITPEENVQLFFHSLRTLIDRGPGNFFIILLCTSRAWNSYQQLGNVRALTSRMGMRPILLEQISLAEAKEIINEYLKAVSIRKEVKTYENLFEPNVIELLWKNSGGNIRQLLISCFYCLELTVQSKLNKVSYNIAQEALSKLTGVPLEKPLLPLMPDSDVAKQIVSKFYSIEKPGERGKILEDSIKSLISLVFGEEKVVGKKREKISKTKSREIDILFYDYSGKLNGVEVKAYDPRKERLVKVKDIEGFIELAKHKKFDRFLLITTSRLDFASQQELSKLSNVKVHVMQEEQVAKVLYVTDAIKDLGRQEKLSKEEAQDILLELEILEKH
ncbi:MAG: restriction endonuclease [Thermoproteota archaeon]